jgi:hypothetical protein
MSNLDEDEGMDMQVVAAAALLANIIAVGRVARLQGERPCDCPFPDFTNGSLAWLSGYTGASISSASGNA